MVTSENEIMTFLPERRGRGKTVQNDRLLAKGVVAFAEDYGKRMEELGAMMDEARG